MNTRIALRDTVGIWEGERRKADKEGLVWKGLGRSNRDGKAVFMGLKKGVKQVRWDDEVLSGTFKTNI